MPSIVTLPSELLDALMALIPASGTVFLSLTCRTLHNRLAYHVHTHAISPVGNLPALHWAVDQGHLPLVRYLLQFFPATLRQPNGNNLLHTACASPINSITASTEMLSLVLSLGLPINEPDSRERSSPLHFLCTSKYSRLRHVHLLITHNADIEQDDSYDGSILNGAIQAGRDDIAMLLARHGADVVQRSRFPPSAAIIAAGEGRAELLRVLLEMGADGSGMDTEGQTPLVQAAGNGKDACVEVLIEAGVDLDRASSGGHTAVCAAVRRGWGWIAVRLLEVGARCDGRNRQGVTLLAKVVEYACDWGGVYIRLVREILDRRYWREGEDVLGEAWKVAQMAGAHQAEVVEILEAEIKKRADMNGMGIVRV